MQIWLLFRWNVFILLYINADSLTKNPGPRFSKETNDFEIPSPNTSKNFIFIHIKLPGGGTGNEYMQKVCIGFMEDNS